MPRRDPERHAREAAEVLEQLERERPEDLEAGWWLSEGTLRALLAEVERRAREGRAA